MVTAGEDAAQAEDDNEEEGRAEGEAKGRSRCVHVVRCHVLTVHSLSSLLPLPSYDRYDGEKLGNVVVGLGFWGWERGVFIYIFIYLR